MHYVAVIENTLQKKLKEELPVLGNPKLIEKLSTLIDKYRPITPETVRQEIAARRAVLPLNFLHANARPMIIGEAFKTKINANIGCSDSVKTSNHSSEIRKLFEAISCGADTVMDLSVGENVTEIRQAILQASTVPVGTVPLYEVLERAGSIEDISWNLFSDVMEQQAKQGVDYMTIHAATRRSHVELTAIAIAALFPEAEAYLRNGCTGKKKKIFYSHTLMKY